MDDKKKAFVALLVGKKAKPSEEPMKDDMPMDDSKEPLKAAASDLINAIHSHDTEGVMEALETAFKACDAIPHEEGLHEDE